jgi:hypothetical protein
MRKAIVATNPKKRPSLKTRREQQLEAALLAAINLAAGLMKPDECIDRASAGQVLNGLRAILDAR